VKLDNNNNNNKAQSFPISRFESDVDAIHPPSLCWLLVHLLLSGFGGKQAEIVIGLEC
jgi:hypothetical protein